MNIIKKLDLMEFVSEKKQMILSKKMESAAEPAVAPPKIKPVTKPGTRPTPSTPKHPKPAVNPKPKAMTEVKPGEEKMSKKVKIDSKDNIEIKKTIKASEGKSKQDIFKVMFIENPELNRSQVAEMLDVSRRTLLNWIKTIEQNQN
jgi:hypothetical protein